MSSSSTFTRPRTGTIVRAVSAVVVLVLVVVGAIIAQGYDTKQTPVVDDSVWVLNAPGGSTPGQYARVDTRLEELDVVKKANLPSTIVQYGSSAMIVTTNNTSMAQLDQARPVEYQSDSPDLTPTPAGTASIEVSGDHVAYLTDVGTMYVSTISAGVGSEPRLVNPYADAEIDEDEDPPIFDANAIAVGLDGVLYAYSAEAGVVFRYDIDSGEQLGTEPVVDGPEKDAIAGLTAVGSTWVLVDSESLSVWTAGEAGVPLGLDDGTTLTVQRASEDDGFVYLATTTGLLRYSIDDGTTEEVAAAQGIAARPTSIGPERFAAWIPASGDSGTMWRSSESDPITLSFGPAGTPSQAEPRPEFRSNGSTLVLNDASNGWVWTAAGALVRSSQDWDLTKTSEDDPLNQAETITPPENPEPPFAIADRLGVRSGELVTLPVLLNDHDPNTGDVLTIVPESVAGLDASFGTLSLTNHDQQLAIAVEPGASGTASFRYSITDGALASAAPAEVTLTVYGADVDTPPVLCSALGPCPHDEPSVQVSPGGSVRSDILDSFVDPEGDPFYVASATLEEPSDVLTLAALPDGDVVVQHQDTTGAPVTATAAIVVEDSRGASTPLSLPIVVTPQPTLSVDSFVTTAQVGETITVDPASHVTGSAGQFSISGLVPPDKAGTAANLNSDGTTFSFSSTIAGDYAVDFSVQSGGSTAVARARITVLDQGALRMAVAPITVFVRPGLDATVDVLSAVSNPGGRVLLLTGVVPLATPDASSLVTNVVDHRLLRVKGSMTKGTSGTLGVAEYTVVDSAGATEPLIGRATIVLLDPASEARPVAVDDSITVRAGTQVDVDVLTNDVAANGNSVVLAGEELAYPADRGLAFVSGSKVRLLAPAQEDQYTITYTVYAAGYPGQRDTAELHVTVRSAEGNTAPQPRSLEARVYSGQTVAIPFSGSGIDPDGDAVQLDRIEEQPQAGAGIANISARGNAIQYAAPEGFSGVAQFSYRVKDSRGEPATALVRVGVLGNQSDPAPVTFSDYVEATVGADSSVEVFPLRNDVDPNGQALVLGEVVPDAPATIAGGQDNPEYAALAALVSGTENGAVTLRAGTEPGTKTFTYTVTNASKSGTSTGYIVLNVVRAAVPDLPVVTDSYLSIDDRPSFATTGIDVVGGGKVSWVSGDVSGLRLSIWGDTSGYRVEGNSIIGALPDATVVIPFQLSGPNRAGQQITTYGFLTVPGINDIIVALRAGFTPQEVKEDESTTFDMNDLVSIPQGDSPVVSGAAAAGQRTEARCALAGTVVTYTAGHGSPWDDACIVTIRLSSQSSDRLTQLVVPVSVEPVDAQPVLVTTAIESRPGKEFPAVQFDLDEMAPLDRWNGIPDEADVAAIEYAYAPSSLQLFDIEGYDRGSHVISIKAKDAAKEGQQEQLTISFAGKYTGQSAALILKVGHKPSTLPKGGSYTMTCTVSDGDCAALTVIGGNGEVNGYDSPLTVTSVDSSSPACPGVTFSHSDSTISADFAQDVAGGTCQVSFVVVDVQDVSSAGTRNGILSLDLKGFPKAPASVKQVGYGDGSIDLRIEPGNAPSSYPSVDYFLVRRDGKEVAQCSADGACPDIVGLVNGKVQSYVVTTVAKETGDESLTSVQTDAYSFAKPTIGSVTATPAYDPARTTVSKGAVDVVIAGAQADVKSFEIKGIDGQVTAQPGSTTTRITLDVGPRDISVTPISKFAVPPGDPLVVESKSAHVEVAGTPTFATQPTTPAPNETSLTVPGASLAANSSTKPIEYLYTAYPSGNGTPRCAVSATGSGPVLSGVTEPRSSTTSTIGDLLPNRRYDIVVCGSNGFGVAQSSVVSQATFRDPGAPTGNYTFDVDEKTFVSGLDTSITYYSDGRISVVDQDAVPDNFQVEFTGRENLGENGTIGSAPDVRARYCFQGFADRCGSWAPVVSADPTKAYQASVRVETEAGDACRGGETLKIPGIQSLPGGQATIEVAPTSATASYSDNAVGYFGGYSAEDPYLVPDSARRVRLQYTIVWSTSATQSGLDGVVFTKEMTCTPKPPPTVPPTSTPSSTPSSSPSSTPSSSPTP